ncbi:hypothetical protein Sgleb_33210 [Streptomyces glebosus]|uniref:Uncharacterized protein n=1 Tax=Streptomyces glebosus TaxID=249580 RepID=A0A640SWN0_9ACTN|nr:hypothetical protein [Streptomyces glebosus]GFE15274.1 hypothetical protein Sgleb_33210 [Streptomyces glebosus]GHG73460.1 hypothetical protein GCM10010513_46870 [Streptomyces glebosus]
MTLTVDDAIHTATETWRRLGVEEATAEEMAEELAADLTAASSDGRSVADYMGGDVEALATSWADERGLVPARPHLKETAVAAAQGAALPALAALAFWYVSWSHLLDPSGTSMATTLDGNVEWEIRQFPNPGVPLMWVGLPLCVVAAFFLIRRAVRGTLQYHHAPVIEATMQALTKTLPVILAAAALLAVGIGYFGDYLVGYFQLLFTIPMALAGMIGAVAAGAAWVRNRTCPPVTDGS